MKSGRLPPPWKRTVSKLKDYIEYINETTRVLDEIADGNLQFELELQYEGDFAKIRDALMRIRTTLNDTLGSILRTAEQVTASSGQVADSTSSLADRKVPGRPAPWKSLPPPSMKYLLM